MLCFDFQSRPVSNENVWVQLCFEEGSNLLREVLVMWEKEYRNGVTWAMDSQIYCNVLSDADFNDSCFDHALSLAEELLRRYEFEERIIEDNPFGVRIVRR